jgi:hypothetical protein
MGQYWGMWIVSLLPSATEIVYALGLEGHLIGVTDECDWPGRSRALDAQVPPLTSAREMVTAPYPTRESAHQHQGGP